jgi:hypothetical protein
VTCPSNQLIKKKKIKLKFATRAEKRNSVNFGKFGGDLPGIFLDKVSSMTFGARAHKIDTNRYAKVIKIVKFSGIKFLTTNFKYSLSHKISLI